MFAKHEVRYFFEKKKRLGSIYPEKVLGDYILECQEDNVTVRYDGEDRENQYSGMIEPHGTIGTRKLWKWKPVGETFI